MGPDGRVEIAEVHKKSRHLGDSFAFRLETVGRFAEPVQRNLLCGTVRSSPGKEARYLAMAFNSVWLNCLT